MTDVHDRIERILPLVRNPAQYVGGEWNIIRKTLTDDTIRVALIFPDTYAIGMSHLGLQILYHVFNTIDDVACERAFMPWVDMQEQLVANDIPLYSLETFTPLAQFDVLAFSLQYELTHSNVLKMLELAGVPIRSADRTASDPIVIAGGPAALNPEPMADFIDLFILGDGEEAAPRFVDAFRTARTAPTRRDMLVRIARENPSAYVPSLYEVSYSGNGRITAFAPIAQGIPDRIRAAVVTDLDEAPFPTAPIVPNTEVIHDRIALEIMRGCMHHCRFCHAGATRRPLRLRSVDKLLQLARTSYENTGCDEISLMSLSTNDYPELERLLLKLDAYFRSLAVNLSVPSLRVGPSVSGLPQLLARVRKSGLTYAPEAATEKLRQIIRKDITLDDLTDGVRQAYAAGWDLVKLYFMIGLPGETEEDLAQIGRLSQRISNLRRDLGKGPAKVNVTISSFIPKPHTPFQWQPMATREYLTDAQRTIRESIRSRKVKTKLHNVSRSFLEAVLSRGDRRLAPVIATAVELGARLDAWDEHFRVDLWQKAFDRHAVDPVPYAHRRRDVDEILPWSHIDVGLPEGYLLEEKKQADEMIAARRNG